MSDTSMMGLTAASSTLISGRVVVTAGSSASMSEAVSSDLCFASALAGSNSGSLILALITLQGGGLGVAGASVASSVEGTRCMITGWLSDTATMCRTTQGAGKSRRMSMSVGLRVGSTSEACSYDSGQVDRMTSNAASTGSLSLSVCGSGLGLAAYTAAAVVGWTACELTAWVSASALLVRSGAGQALPNNRAVAATVGWQVGSVSKAYTVDGVHLSGAAVSNAGLTVASRLTIQSADLGPGAYSCRASAASTACESTAWVSYTAVTCWAAFYVPRSMPLSLTAGSMPGSVSVALSWDSALASGAGFRANTGDAGRPSSLTVQGQGFGVLRATQGLSVGGTACEAGSWMSDTSMMGLPAVIATRISGRVVMTSGFLFTISSLISYDSIVLSGLSPSNIGSGFYSQITLFGSGIGLGSGFATLGFSAFEVSYWASDSCVVCMVTSASSSSLRISFTSGAMPGSCSSLVSYSDVSINDVSSSNLASTGNILFVADGWNLGHADYSFSALLGMTSSQENSWISSTSVRCKASLGVGRSLMLSVTTGSKSNTLSSALSYDSPSLVISAMSGQNRSISGSWCSNFGQMCSCQGIVTFMGVNNKLFEIVDSSSSVNCSQGQSQIISCYCFNRPFQGGGTILIIGNGFGSADYSPAASFSGSTAQITTWLSQSSLQCKLPLCSACGGSSNLESIVVTVAKQRSVLQNVSFNYLFQYSTRRQQKKGSYPYLFAVSGSARCPHFWAQKGSFILASNVGMVCRIDYPKDDKLEWIIDPCQGALNCDSVQVDSESGTHALLQSRLVILNHTTGSGDILRIFSCT